MGSIPKVYVCEFYDPPEEPEGIYVIESPKGIHKTVRDKLHNVVTDTPIEVDTPLGGIRDAHKISCQMREQLKPHHSKLNGDDYTIHLDFAIPSHLANPVWRGDQPALYFPVSIKDGNGNAHNPDFFVGMQLGDPPAKRPKPPEDKASQSR